MDEATAGAWVAAGVAMLVGVVGWAAAGIANREAKKANRLAKHANDIAADALRQAAEANEIAEHANHLSEEANTIARAQALQQVDPSHVEWAAKFDAEASVLHVTNRGRDTAVDASVLFNRDGVQELVRGEEHLPSGGEVLIPFPDVPERREGYEFRQAQIISQARAQRIAMAGTKYGFPIELDIRWLTEAGNPRQQTVKGYIS